MIGKCCCIMIGLITGCVLFVGITILVYSLAFAKILPKAMPHYEVTNASLTKFNLTANNNFLDYNLSLKLSIENPEGLDYNFTRLDAVPAFKGQNLNDMTSVSKPFNLKQGTNVTFPVLFSGNHSVALGAHEVYDFGKANVFDIVLKINSEYSLKMKKKEMSLTHDVTCDLKVPMNSNVTNVGERFQITKCKVDKIHVNQ